MPSTPVPHPTLTDANLRLEMQRNLDALRVTTATMQHALDALAGGGGYTDEQARDAIGAALADSSTIDFTYNDGADTISAALTFDPATQTELDAVDADKVSLTELLQQDLAGDLGVKTLYGPDGGALDLSTHDSASLFGGGAYLVLDGASQYVDISVPAFASMFAPVFADQGTISANWQITSPDLQRQKFEPTAPNLALELPDPIAGNPSHQFFNKSATYNLLLTMQAGTATSLPDGVFVIGPKEAVEVSCDSTYWEVTRRRRVQALVSRYADAGTPSSAAETTLYSDSIPGDTLYNNGDALLVTYGGSLANNANTKRLRAKFDGTTYLDTTALTGSAAGHWVIETLIVRVDSTHVRCISRALVNGVTVTAPIVSYLAITTGNLNAARTLLLTGQNGTSSANDIVAREANVRLIPAP